MFFVVAIAGFLSLFVAGVPVVDDNDVLSAGFEPTSTILGLETILPTPFAEGAFSNKNSSSIVNLTLEDIRRLQTSIVLLVGYKKTYEATLDTTLLVSIDYRVATSRILLEILKIWSDFGISSTHGEYYMVTMKALTQLGQDETIHASLTCQEIAYLWFNILTDIGDELPAAVDLFKALQTLEEEESLSEDVKRMAAVRHVLNYSESIRKYLKSGTVLPPLRDASLKRHLVEAQNALAEFSESNELVVLIQGGEMLSKRQLMRLLVYYHFANIMSSIIDVREMISVKYTREAFERKELRLREMILSIQKSKTRAFNNVTIQSTMIDTFLAVADLSIRMISHLHIEQEDLKQNLFRWYVTAVTIIGASRNLMNREYVLNSTRLFLEMSGNAKMMLRVNDVINQPFLWHLNLIEGQENVIEEAITKFQAMIEDIDKQIHEFFGEYEYKLLSAFQLLGMDHGNIKTILRVFHGGMAWTVRTDLELMVASKSTRALEGVKANLIGLKSWWLEILASLEVNRDYPMNAALSILEKAKRYMSTIHDNPIVKQKDPPLYHAASNFIRDMTPRDTGKKIDLNRVLVDLREIESAFSRGIFADLGKVEAKHIDVGLLSRLDDLIETLTDYSENKRIALLGKLRQSKDASPSLMLKASVDAASFYNSVNVKFFLALFSNMRKGMSRGTRAQLDRNIEKMNHLLQIPLGPSMVQYLLSVREMTIKEFGIFYVHFVTCMGVAKNIISGFLGIVESGEGQHLISQLITRIEELPGLSKPGEKEEPVKRIVADLLAISSIWKELEAFIDHSI